MGTSALRRLKTAAAGINELCEKTLTHTLCGRRGDLSSTGESPMRLADGASAHVIVACLCTCQCAVSRGAAGEPEHARSIEEVVVTGSRIPRDSSGLAAPLTVMDAADLARGGQDSLGKALQTLPFSAGSPTNTNVNQGGDGSVRIDLRGLDPSRTLVLLNGRRFPNGGVGGDTSVDLNSLPLSLIDHVEVLTNGASAIYGADAVAGVVNVITRRDFRGIEMGAQQAITEHGDGGIVTAQFLAGTVVGDSAWAAGLEYVNQDGVTEAEREYSAAPLRILEPGGAPQPVGSGSIPEGRFDVPAGNALGLERGRYTHVTGVSGRGAEAWRPFTLDDLFNFAPYQYSQTPNERAALWLLGTHTLADETTVFVEGLLHRRESSQRFAPTPYFSEDVAPLLANGERGIPASNYYNPFGVDLTVVRRRLVELGDRGFDQEIDLWRAVVGVRGRVANWTWEAAASASEGVARTTEIGLVAFARFVPALGSSGPDASGRIVCGARDPATGVVPAANVIAGCVPLDLFGGVGSITREQTDYLGATLNDRGENSQRFIDVSLEGPWGRLPAGELRWALGAEYRREAGQYKFDPLRKTGIAGSPGETDVPGGAFAARELYVEVRAPLLRDKPRTRAMDLTAGVRLSDFSSFGEHATWQSGLHWRPLEPWALRINYARVFRAPNLTELYQAPANGFDESASDPCGASPTPEQSANCAANGVPGGAYVQTDPGLPVLIGGNPHLAPESGASFSAGVDFRRASPPELRASLDFFNVELDHVVAYPSANDILRECADNGTPAICGRIQRRADGTVVRVDVRPQNFHRTVASGFDFAGSLALGTRAGLLSAGFNATYLMRRDDQLFQDSSPARLAGTIAATPFTTGALPRWRAIANLNLERDAWTMTYAAQFLDASTECGDGSGFLDGIECRSVDSTLYHDVESSYRFDAGIELRAGISNLTDEDPPFVNNWTGANTDAATYRLLGRTYFAQMIWRIR
jgi:iron complex outermembrane recepter protein